MIAIGGAAEIVAADVSSAEANRTPFHTTACETQAATETPSTCLLQVYENADPRPFAPILNQACAHRILHDVTQYLLGGFTAPADVIMC